MVNHTGGEVAELFEPAFRTIASSAIGEFEAALFDVVGAGTAAQREAVLEAARSIIRVAAGVLVRIE